MFATIDIGTNSVLLLVGETRPDGRINIVADEARISRLGQGICSQENLQAEAIDRTISILKEYTGICDKHHVSAIAAVGTAALREVANAQAFVSRVKEELNLEVEIIPPEREAWLTFLPCARDFGSDTLVCDIGGGSTELIWGKPGAQKGKPHHEDCQFMTIPLGSVLLTEQFIKSDPVTKDEFHELCAAIDQQLNHALSSLSHRHSEKMVATAGTATTIAAVDKKMTSYDHKKIHGTVLEMLDIQVIIDMIKMRTIAERKKIPGIQHGREDVIFAGSIILDRVMRRLGYDVVTISDKGLRWGLFYERFVSSSPYNNV